MDPRNRISVSVKRDFFIDVLPEIDSHLELE